MEERLRERGNNAERGGYMGWSEHLQPETVFASGALSYYNAQYSLGKEGKCPAAMLRKEQKRRKVCPRSSRLGHPYPGSKFSLNPFGPLSDPGQDNLSPQILALAGRMAYVGTGSIGGPLRMWSGVGRMTEMIREDTSPRVLSCISRVGLAISATSYCTIGRCKVDAKEPL